MDDFHTDYSFRKQLCNKMERVRSVHHGSDFFVAYGGRCDRRRHLSGAKTPIQRVSIADFIKSIWFFQK